MDIVETMPHILSDGSGNLVVEIFLSEKKFRFVLNWEVSLKGF